MAKKEEYEEYEKKPKLKNVLIVLGILFVIGIAVISAFPIKYVATEEYKIIEMRDISEAYKEPYDCSFEESYKEPYDCSSTDINWVMYDIDYGVASRTCIQEECSQQERYCKEKNFWGNCVKYGERCVQYSCIKYKISCKVVIENKEREGYTFSVNMRKYDYDDRDYTLISRKNTWISALSSKTLYWDFTYLSTDSVTCSANLETIPTREVTTEKTCYRTKTKTIPKTCYQSRTKLVSTPFCVTKTRQVSKTTTLLNQWTGNTDYHYKVEGGCDK